LARKDEFILIPNYGTDDHKIIGWRLQSRKQFKTREEAYDFIEKLE